MRRPVGRAGVAGVAAVLVLRSPAAEAHLVNTGLGPVYDGISHLLLSFDDLLPVMAMALLAGLRGAAAGRRALLALPPAWLLSGLLGYSVGTVVLPAGAPALSLLALGILTAADRPRSPAPVPALALLLGLVHGWQNGAGIAAAGQEPSGLIGIALAIFSLSALVSAWVVALRRPWARVVVRVAGSWLAATGLLELGWALRGRW